MYEKFSRDLDSLVDGILEEQYMNRDSLRRKIGMAMSISFNEIVKKSALTFNANREILIRELKEKVKNCDISINLAVDKAIKAINDSYQHQKVIKSISELSEYERLKKYVKQKLGDKSLNDFINTLGNKGN